MTRAASANATAAVQLDVLGVRFTMVCPASCVTGAPGASSCPAEVCRSVAALGGFASQESGHFHRILGNGACLGHDGMRRTVVDVGANVGYFTLFAAAHGCNVLAIEPQPYAAELIRKSLAANHASLAARVEVITTLISTEQGARYSVHFPHRRTWGWASFRSDAKGTVHAARLDTLMDEVVAQRFPESAGHLLLLKVDTEGMELPVLDSAPQLLTSRRVEHMLLEIKSPLSRPKQELLKRLLAAGYSLNNYVEDYRLHARDFATRRQPLNPWQRLPKGQSRAVGRHARVEVLGPDKVAHGEDFYLQLKPSWWWRWLPG